MQSLAARQASPAAASGEHVPQAAPAERAQRVLSHCASSLQAWPFARAPGANRQASGKALSSSAPHSTLASKLEHASSPAAELTTSGLACRVRQAAVLRALQVATSP
jgi:hypothetical protein